MALGKKLVSVNNPNKQVTFNLISIFFYVDGLHFRKQQDAIQFIISFCNVILCFSNQLVANYAVQTSDTIKQE